MRASIVGLFVEPRNAYQSIKLDQSINQSIKLDDPDNKLLISADITFTSLSPLNLSSFIAQLEFVIKYAVYHSLEALSILISGWMRNCTRLTFHEQRTPAHITDYTIDLTLITPFELPLDIMRRYTKQESQLEFVSPHADINQWGTVDVLAEVDHTIQSPTCGLYQLNLYPQNSIPLHVHHIMSESEMCLSSQMLCLNQSIEFGAIHEWKTRAHCYHNPLEHADLSVLCLDSPVFIPSDEVLVDQGVQSMDVEKCYIAGTDTFQSILRHARDQQNPASINRIIFDGAYPNQKCELYFDRSKHLERGNAILFYLFDYQGRLCFVNHRKRGLELIGGKIDPNETEIEALLRETYEEANLVISINQFTQLIRIAQYRLIDSEGSSVKTHIKSVYIAQLASDYQFSSSSVFHHETSDVRWLNPPSHQSILSSNQSINQSIDTSHQSISQSNNTSHQSINQSINHDQQDLKYSILLYDHVYPFCLRVAQAALELTDESL